LKIGVSYLLEFVLFVEFNCNLGCYVYFPFSHLLKS